MKIVILISLIALLQTASYSVGAPSLEEEIVIEMNLARANPALYAEMYIAPMISRFNGDTLTYFSGLRTVTKEGVTAARECIEVMKNVQPSQSLEYSIGLSLGALDHARDLKDNNKTGHKGTDSSYAPDRVKRYGTCGTVVAENIQYGLYSARDIVVGLLIDDGVKSRGHRTIILSPRFAYTGIAFWTHPEYKFVCVITYSDNFVRK